MKNIFKQILIVIGIILSLYLADKYNYYLQSKPIKIKVINHAFSNGRYNSLPILIMQEEKTKRVFEYYTDYAYLQIMPIGTEKTILLRKLDWYQTGKENIFLFFGYVIFQVLIITLLGYKIYILCKEIKRITNK